MSAPVEELARSALATTASQFVEVQRPNFIGMGGPDAPLRSLRFATAPEMAGYPGLCKATTVWVDVASGYPPMGTSTVYKVVGDLAPLPDMWNEAYRAELRRKCAAAGRVIPSESADFGQVAFFEISKGGEDQVWTASRALQLAIAGAKVGAPITCISEPGIDAEALREMAADDPEAVEDRENREGCVRASTTFASLSLGRILRMEIAPCPEVKANVYCLSASFLRYAYNNHQALWFVELRYEEGKGDNHDVTSVSAVTLKPSFAIYD